MELFYKNEVYSVIGAAMEVHRTLGCGFHESVYQESLSYEFLERKIPYEKEVRLELKYKDRILDKYYIADFVCFNAVIAELKAVSNLIPEHEAQVINYLKATGIKVGLLINFGKTSLEYKRIVY